MYSAVLMLALTAGSETADFGRNRCAGSTAYACSSSGAVGCSYAAPRAGLFSRHHSCSSSGMYGSSNYGCSGNYACGGRTGLFSGGLFGGHHGRSSGYACSGGYPVCSGGMPVCSGGIPAGCSMGTPVVPPAAKPLPPVKPSEPVPAPAKKTTQSTAPATIIVSLPADARLFVDGTATTSTTDRRTLLTPELVVGATYVYTMRAEVVRDGQVQSQSQQVNVIGGQTANVQFSLSSQGVASR